MLLRENCVLSLINVIFNSHVRKVSPYLRCKHHVKNNGSKVSLTASAVTFLIYTITAKTDAHIMIKGKIVCVLEYHAIKVYR
jgi:hypothetical protein